MPSSEQDDAIAQTCQAYRYTLDDLFRAANAHSRIGAEPCERTVRESVEKYCSDGHVPSWVTSFIGALDRESKKVSFVRAQAAKRRRSGRYPNYAAAGSYA